MSRASEPIDEAAEMREHEAFMRTLDPAITAAAEWHTRHADGIRADEDAQFQQWLASDPAHARAYAEVDRSHAAVRRLPAQGIAHLAPPVLDAACAARKPTSRSDSPSSGRFQWMPVLTAFATGCLLLVAVVVGWHQWHQPMFSQRYATQQGQRLDAALPDGSELKLDAVTRTDVALYRDRREARLSEGQAMFAIAPDAGKPFQVTAGAARITVVGTRFSVRYTGSGKQAGLVEVAVEEGTVRVESTLRPTGAASVLTLTAGQSVQVSASGDLGPVATVAVGSVALWRKGLVRFSDTPLVDAIREMDRYGPTRLVVSDPTLADLRIGGSFEVARPQELAKVLSSILPVELVLRPDGNREVIRRR